MSSVAVPSVVSLMAASNTSRVSGTPGRGFTCADSAYSVMVYDLSPGPCEHGGEYVFLRLTVFWPQVPASTSPLWSSRRRGEVGDDHVHMRVVVSGDMMHNHGECLGALRWRTPRDGGGAWGCRAVAGAVGSEAAVGHIDARDCKGRCGGLGCGLWCCRKSRITLRGGVSSAATGTTFARATGGSAFTASSASASLHRWACGVVLVCLCCAGWINEVEDPPAALQPVVHEVGFSGDHVLE